MMPRPKSNRRAGASALIFALVLGSAGVACAKNESGTPSPPTDGSENQGTTASGAATFALPKDPGAAIKASGLPELAQESFVVHEHAHLDITVNGQAVTVPEGIGITKTGISPLHTHDNLGIVHIEAEKPDSFTIGQLFTEWGVKLDKNCLGTYCTDDKNQLLGFVNGQLVPDPASIPISRHAEIVIWYGPKGSNPKVPATYEFKDGL